MDSRRISIVVPVYNEEESIETLLREIREVSGPHDWTVEVVFVDDGSDDESWAQIAALSEADPLVGGLRFQKNAGKAAALMAGFAAARGDLVFMMDADLQDPPVEMHRFVDMIDAGWDVVSGWKKIRHDPWHKVYPSHVFNRLISRLTGVRLHDHVCGFKCLRREVLPHLRLYGEFHRFVGVLAAGKGFKVTEIPTLHRPRTTGVGKYGFARFAKGFVDLLSVVLLTRFGWRPQHLIGVAGLWLIVLSLLLVVLNWCLCGVMGRIVAPIITLVAAIVPGLILIAIGLTAQLVIAQRPADEQYIIADRAGWCGETSTQKDT